MVQRDPYFGLAISSPIEKGLSFIALLEEGGVVGFSLFIIVLTSFFSPLLKRTAGLAPLALSLATLLVNFGEGVLFSMGGFGLLNWLFWGFASSTAQQGEKG